MDIGKIDENLKVDNTIDDTGLVWYSVDEAPFRIYGVFRDEDGYRRVPRDVAEAISEALEILAAQTSGGRVRFVTNSSRVAIRVTMPYVKRASHMPFTGAHGFDLYADGVFTKTFVPPSNMKTGYESLATLDGRSDRLFTLNMPLYNAVSRLFVGIDADAELKAAPDYKYDKPVVYYGSSITQGGCASRPGTCYQGFLSRALDCDYINLGFSGNGKGDLPISEYIATLDMSAFVMDYDHNAPSAEHLEATHGRLFDLVRGAHPNLPIVIISRPTYYLNNSENTRRECDRRRRLEIVHATYERALAAGDKNVYFIDGATLIGPDVCDGTVDGIHPTDLGFYSMASVILPVLKKALGEE